MLKKPATVVQVVQNIRQVVTVKAGSFKIQKDRVYFTAVDGKDYSIKRSRLVWYSEHGSCVICFEKPFERGSFNLVSRTASKYAGFVFGKTPTGKVLLNEAYIKEEKDAGS